jgi:hypothetical protein
VNVEKGCAANSIAKAALSGLNISGGGAGIKVSGAVVGRLSDVDGAGCGMKNIFEDLVTEFW